MLKQHLQLCAIIILISWPTSFAGRSKSKDFNLKTFDEWQCSSLCQNIQTVQSICEYLSRGRYTDGVVPRPISWVRENSKCESALVQLKSSEQGPVGTYNKQVGMCYMTEQRKFCITSARKKSDLNIYTINENNACVLTDTLVDYEKVLKNDQTKRKKEQKNSVKPQKIGRRGGTVSRGGGGSRSLLFGCCVL